MKRATLNRILAATTLAVLIGTSAAWAKGPASGGDKHARAEERFEQLSARLELSDDQEEQIRPILAEGGKQMRDLRERYRGEERSRETAHAMREEAQKLHLETRSELEPILSAEQLEEYDALVEERIAERRGSRDRDKHAPD